jgi:hypothetical protein
MSFFQVYAAPAVPAPAPAALPIRTPFPPLAIPPINAPSPAPPPDEAAVALVVIFPDAALVVSCDIG